MRKARDTAHFCCLRSLEGVCACLYPCNSCLKGFDIALCVLVPCCGSADTHLLLVSVRCAANNNEKKRGKLHLLLRVCLAGDCVRLFTKQVSSQNDLLYDGNYCHANRHIFFSSVHSRSSLSFSFFVPFLTSHLVSLLVCVPRTVLPLLDNSVTLN